MPPRSHFLAEGSDGGAKMGNFRNSSFFLFLPITLLKNVRFWTIIPFWKPQAIYLLVLSRKMAKNFQKYPHQGTEVKNPKFDQPHAGMCIFFILASNLVFNLKILSEYPYVNFWVLFALDFNLWGGQKLKKLEKSKKNGKKWKNPVTWYKSIVYLQVALLSIYLCKSSEYV